MMRLSAHATRRFLLAGFGALLAVLVLMSVIGVMRTERVNAELQATLQEQDAKMSHVAAVFRATHERSQILQALFLSEARVARADAAERFRQAGEEMDTATRALSAMALTKAERNALVELIAAGQHARDVRDEALALLLRGEAAVARKLAGASGVVLQDTLQEALVHTLESNRAATIEVVERARQSTRTALITFGAIGILVMLAALVLAYLLAREVKRTEYALQVEKELAQVTLHSIGDGVITTDAGARVEYLNPVAEQYTGWTTAEAKGLPLAEVYRVSDERTGKSFDPLKALPPLPAGVETEAVSVRLLARGGSECPIRYSHAPIRAADGRAFGTIVVFHDISAIRAMAQQLLWQASHDALTGLVNRREFERRLSELIDTARTQPGREHALMFMDLDNFKAVNDTCGHTAGDELLRQLTSVMLSRMRGSDTLARLGGDEFGALLESCPFDQALRIANAMRETVREFRFVWEAKTFSVGVSIGLVPIAADSGNFNRVLSLADACCYDAKNKGRDRVQVYRPEDEDESSKHGELQLVAQINQAFELGHFRLYRQRIAPVAPGAPQHPFYQVLIRMIDRAGNLVPPTGFMPAAERYNLLTSIERWVVSSLIEYLHHERSTGAIPREASARGWYSVNLSGASINDKSLPDFLRNLLTRYQLPPGLLCFEITETTAISNLNTAAELMRELKGMGCRFALDDFGTGMSSFAYLKYLPVDVLKIAGTFILDMTNDPMDLAIVDAINRISHILGMQTVAESVENAEALAKIAELGIDYAQGYFIAEPEALVQLPDGQSKALASA